MFNKKYTYAGLDIELTRRCNKQCAHCLRGEAQSVTITKEIIDSIMDDVDDCAGLYISGGEPLLEPDMLFYLLEQVSNHWNTYLIEITSNGSILDTNVVDALEQFCKTPTQSSKTPRKAQLTISSDQYHTPEDCQKALDFYRPLFDAANERLGCSGDDKRLLLKTWSPIDADQQAEKDGKPILIYAGRGIDLAKNDHSFVPKKSLKIPNTNAHRLKIKDNIVYCTVKITANGDVVLASEDDSFESDDANASGNILSENLSHIINAHQESCLMTCAESNIVNSERTRVVYGKNGHRFEEALSTQFLYLVAMMILEVRTTVKQLYPMLSASDIILGLPMPKSPQEVFFYAKKIYESIPSDITPKIDEYELRRFDARKKRLSTDERDFCTWALTDVAYMQEADKKQLFNLFVKLSDTKLDALYQKHCKYEKHLNFPDNGHVFTCGSNNLFECNDTRDNRYVE